jgi:hypothetical protein
MEVDFKGFKDAKEIEGIYKKVIYICETKYENQIN